MSYSYNEIKPRDTILYNDEPHEVVSVHVARKQQRKPTNQATLKNLLSGKQYNVTFYPRDTLEAAQLENKEVAYLYANRGEVWFHEVSNPSERFSVSEELVAEQIRFMKEKDTATAVFFDDAMIGLKIPVKVELAVTEAPPNIKGDTSSGGNKVVTVETGYSLTTPLFINNGDIIRINTDTGEYVERVEKA